MGVDWHSYTIIGCEIDIDSFNENEVRRSTCPHNYDVAYPYCPHCGNETIVFFENPIRDAIDTYSELKNAGRTIRFVTTTDEERIFAGLCRAEAGEYDNAQRVKFDFTTIKQQTQEALEPLGMWSEETFGLWVVQYCSY